MLKYFFRLLLLIGAVVGIFAVIGSLLPRDYEFESQVNIVAPPVAIFDKIEDLRNWQQWSKQWNPAAIQGLEIQYSGAQSGAGAVQTWTDPRGKGKLWITESQPFERVDYKAIFGEFPEMDSRIELSDQGTSTQIVWSSEGSLPGGPFYGFFGAFFSTQMKHQYDMSLESLKAIVEREQNF